MPTPPEGSMTPLVDLVEQCRCLGQGIIDNLLGLTAQGRVRLLDELSLRAGVPINDRGGQNVIPIGLPVMGGLDRIWVRRNIPGAMNQLAYTRRMGGCRGCPWTPGCWNQVTS